MEFKRPQELFPRGQREWLEFMSTQPNIAVLLVHGTPSQPQGYKWCIAGKWYPSVEIDRRGLQRLVEDWYANGDLPF